MRVTGAVSVTAGCFLPRAVRRMGIPQSSEGFRTLGVPRVIDPLLLRELGRQTAGPVVRDVSDPKLTDDPNSLRYA